MVELTYAGKVLNNRGFSAALTFGTVLILYFILSYPLTLLGRWLEARLATPRSSRSMATSSDHCSARRSLSFACPCTSHDVVVLPQ